MDSDTVRHFAIKINREQILLKYELAKWILPHVLKNEYHHLQDFKQFWEQQKGQLYKILCASDWCILRNVAHNVNVYSSSFLYYLNVSETVNSSDIQKWISDHDLLMTKLK